MFKKNIDPGGTKYYSYAKGLLHKLKKRLERTESSAWILKDYKKVGGFLIRVIARKKGMDEIHITGQEFVPNVFWSIGNIDPYFEADSPGNEFFNDVTASTSTPTSINTNSQAVGYTGTVVEKFKPEHLNDLIAADDGLRRILYTRLVVNQVSIQGTNSSNWLALYSPSGFSFDVLRPTDYERLYATLESLGFANIILSASRTLTDYYEATGTYNPITEELSIDVPERRAFVNVPAETVVLVPSDSPFGALTGIVAGESFSDPEKPFIQQTQGSKIRIYGRINADTNLFTGFVVDDANSGWTESTYSIDSFSLPSPPNPGSGHRSVVDIENNRLVWHRTQQDFVVNFEGQPYSGYVKLTDVAGNVETGNVDNTTWTRNIDSSGPTTLITHSYSNNPVQYPSVPPVLSMTALSESPTTADSEGEEWVRTGDVALHLIYRKQGITFEVRRTDLTKSVGDGATVSYALNGQVLSNADTLGFEGGGQRMNALQNPNDLLMISRTGDSQEPGGLTDIWSWNPFIFIAPFTPRTQEAGKVNPDAYIADWLPRVNNGVWIYWPKRNNALALVLHKNGRDTAWNNYKTAVTNYVTDPNATTEAAKNNARAALDAAQEIVYNRGGISQQLLDNARSGVLVICSD